MSHAYAIAVVLTHPVQYFAPWFRYIAADRPDVRLAVFYATRPSAGAQGEGFGTAFAWDEDLTSGYDAHVLDANGTDQSLLATGYSMVDAPGLEDALAAFGPDAVVVPGWHAAAYDRAARACRTHGWPMIYRGDSTLLTSPTGVRRLAWRARTWSRLRRYDAWLSVGQHARAYLAAFGIPDPLIFASPHAVDHARFAAKAAAARAAGARARVRQAQGLDADAFVVGFVGRLAAGKRPLDIVDAVASLSQAQVLFVGAGELQGACAERAREAGVRAGFTGFVNQSGLADAYVACDVVAVPSASDTWGLVVNEALACGVPCIVTERVGCGPDLIRQGASGSVVPVGDVAALAREIDHWRRDATPADARIARCQAVGAEYSFARATDGLVASVTRMTLNRDALVRTRRGQPRVLACCGNMVIAGGLERRTFDVLRALAAHGAGVHAVVNTWESGPIVALAEQVGASWSTGYYWQVVTRSRSPWQVARILWDACRTSAGLVRDARRLRATAVLVPEYHAAVRNWPGLVWMRLRGARVVMRLGNAPGRDWLHRLLWRVALTPFVHEFGCNSRFIANELAALGVPRRKIAVIYNAVPTDAPSGSRPVDPHRVIYVGQIIPPKGVDVLLDAMGLLRGAGIDASLDVVGAIDGWESPAYAGYRGRLRARAERPDLRDHVRFLGKRSDVLTLMAEAAVHCCPSLPEQREGLAGVVLEAKRAGVPSVVTRTGSLPELVTHDVDGWVADAPTAESLARGLAHFLTQPDVRARASLAATDSAGRFGRGAFDRGWCDAFGITGAGA